MATTLQIYRAPSGQWSGRILVDGQEVAAIAGCLSATDVEETAWELGYDFDSVKTV